MSSYRTTALAFASAISNRRIDEAASDLAEDFLWRPHPERLGGLGRPEGHSKTQFVEAIKALTSIKRWNFNTENPMKLHGRPEHVSGKVLSAEYVYMIDFDQEGKIQILDEFFDIVYLQDLAALSS
ncbi:uncharacterized protein IL334_004359 [Kwoniella shivajii]|uniref:SnoaL-like domain-containing protein n=1 Tax=Kwoniella shivajii TaxID=564305 RepID=A0ABZ1D047_9TREE|nr:hypothetical protein IL334_004359 [Kwoniella shivajii]